MITVLKQGTTVEQRDQLIKWFEDQGLRVHVSVGEYQTVLGLIGDTTKVDTDMLELLDIVDFVKRITEPFKNANRKFHPEDTVIDVGGAKIGGGNFAVIAGPCSVETEEQIMLPWAAKSSQMARASWHASSRLSSSLKKTPNSSPPKRPVMACLSAASFLRMAARARMTLSPVL